MNIYYIANSRIPTEKAHGIQIMKMCEAFARLGHSVKLIVPKRVSHLTDDAFAFYGLAPSFEIVYLPTIDLIRWSGVVPKVFALLQNYSFSRSVKKYLAANQPDFIYTRDELTAKIVPAGIPMILEVHNTSRILKNSTAVLNQRLSQISVITQGLKDTLAKMGYDENKISVFHDGVDLEDFKIQISKADLRKELNLPGDKKIVLYTGNFMQWKGTNILALASKNFFAGTIFMYAGGSPFDLGNFKNFLEANKLTEKNVLLGHVSHSQIPKYLMAADALVLPNSGKEAISRFFTSPLKLFEYMASATPIVASSLPSIEEVLNDSNSVLVQPDDPQALAAGIKKVLDNPELARKIGQQAASDVRQYDWRERAKKILELV